MPGADVAASTIGRAPIPAKACGSATCALRTCGGALQHSRSVAYFGAARAACTPRRVCRHLQRNAAERPCVHGRRPLRHVLVLKAGCGVCPVGQRVGAVHLQASTSPGADVARASRVPVQMWHGRAQSRCRCGTLESSPDANVANECCDAAGSPLAHLTLPHLHQGCPRLPRPRAGGAAVRLLARCAPARTSRCRAPSAACSAARCAGACRA